MNLNALIIVLSVMVSSAFGKQLYTFFLNSGEKVNCPSLIKKTTYKSDYFICGEDTILPEEIRGLNDSSGYHPYIEKTFFSKKISGKVSLYSGNIHTLELCDFGIKSSAIVMRPVVTNKLFYTFDDSVYHEFYSLRSNKPLLKEFKKCPDAYSSLKRYRLSTLSSGIAVGTSTISLIGSLFSLSGGKKEQGITLLSISATGFVFSAIMQGFAAQRYFKRAIEQYNSN